MSLEAVATPISHPNQFTAKWTKERTELLVLRHSEGVGCRNIAAEIGGVTKNAVIGKLNRMGLFTPMSERRVRLKAARVAEVAKRRIMRSDNVLELNFSRRKDRERGTPDGREKAAQSRRSKLEAIEVVDLTAHPHAVAFADITDHTCRWPLGDPRAPDALRFCGDAPHPSYVYCKAHCLMAYEVVHRQTAP